MKNREYYTEFARVLPKVTIALTAGRAKYRYNKLNLGDIGGIPRVLDAGHCNDSYSLAVIALLAPLYLRVKNIHLGPTLPAFLSPNVVKVLVEKFYITGITDVKNDLLLFPCKLGIYPCISLSLISRLEDWLIK